MGAGHAHAHDDVELTPAQQRHQRQGLRILIAALIPLAVATFAALVWLWPHDVSAHVRDDTGTVRVSGTTVQIGTITKVTTTDCRNEVGTFPGDTSVCAKVTVIVNDGPDEGTHQQFDINSAIYESGVKVGQKVRMYRVPVEGMTIYSFIDFERTVPLYFFVGLFALLVVVVARLRGFLSLVGLGFAFWILTQFMLPNLIIGRDPLLVGIVASAAIMFVVLYTSHGFTVRTTTALVGTLFGLGVAAVLGLVATRWGHLTGVVHEDDYMLMASAPSLSLTSVVICSMIIGALGALNDVTITQASAVWELARTEKRPWPLYRSAMRIGRDHIASTVYTIAFASAGAAMGTLLLITIYHKPMGEMLVEEMFAGEVLRTVIGSIGLVLAAPLTTLVGVLAVTAGRHALSPADAASVTAPAASESAHAAPVSAGLATASPGHSRGEQDDLDRWGSGSAAQRVIEEVEDDEPAPRPRRGDDAAFRRPPDDPARA